MAFVYGRPWRNSSKRIAPGSTHPDLNFSTTLSDPGPGEGSTLPRQSTHSLSTSCLQTMLFTKPGARSPGTLQETIRAQGEPCKRGGEGSGACSSGCEVVGRMQTRNEPVNSCGIVRSWSLLPCLLPGIDLSLTCCTLKALLLGRRRSRLTSLEAKERSLESDSPTSLSNYLNTCQSFQVLGPFSCVESIDE